METPNCFSLKVFLTWAFFIYRRWNPLHSIAALKHISCFFSPSVKVLCHVDGSSGISHPAETKRRKKKRREDLWEEPENLEELRHWGRTSWAEASCRMSSGVRPLRSSMWTPSRKVRGSVRVHDQDQDWMNRTGGAVVTQQVTDLDGVDF